MIEASQGLIGRMVRVMRRLDHLTGSPRQRVEAVEDLAGREIRLHSLSESIDTTTAGGRLVMQAALTEAAAEQTRTRRFARPATTHERSCESHER